MIAVEGEGETDIVSAQAGAEKNIINKDEIGDAKTAPVASTEKGNSLIWIFVGVGIILVLVIVILVVFLIKKKNNASSDIVMNSSIPNNNQNPNDFGGGNNQV